MKVVVTGASGHIGNCLIRELKKNGAEVRALVHNIDDHLSQFNVELVRGNILEPENLTSVFEGVDIVYHLAAQIPLDNKPSDSVFETNVRGTKNVLMAAQKASVRRLIHFSSIDAFQTRPSEELFDENRPLLESRKKFYGFTKAEGERLVLLAVKEGLDAVILNPTAVVGPFDYKGSYLGKALIKIYQNKLPMLVAGGFNWVDVRDVVSAALQSITSAKKGNRYILGGNYYIFRDLSEMISKISGSKTPGMSAPVSMARLATPFMALFASITQRPPLFTNHSLNLIADSSKNISTEKAHKELNYNPRSLEETLKDTFDWYREHKYLD